MTHTSKHRVWSPKHRLVRNIPETFKGLGLSQQSAFCPQKAMLAGTQQFYSPFVEISNLTVTKLPLSEETVGGINLPSTVTLTKKEAIMRKVKLIVHETYQGKRKSEDVFAAVFRRQGTVLCLDGKT